MLFSAEPNDRDLAANYDRQLARRACLENVVAYFQLVSAPRRCRAASKQAHIPSNNGISGLQLSAIISIVCHLHVIVPVSSRARPWAQNSVALCLCHPINAIVAVTLRFFSPHIHRLGYGHI